MADLIIPGRNLRDLDFLPDAIEAELYAEKGGSPWRIKVGEPNGIPTLGSDGKVPSTQLPTDVADAPGNIAALDARLDTVEAGQTAGMLGYATKALMTDDLAHAEGTLALVTNDDVDPVANNGTYLKSGASGAGSWGKSEDRVTGLEGRVTAAEQTLDPISDAFPGEVNEPDLMAFTDGAGKEFGRVKANAGWAILLDTIQNAAGLSVYEMDVIGMSAEAVVVDANGKILGQLGGTDPEIEAARGTRTSLDARLSQSLSAYGLPKQYIWGEWYLRETRQRLRKRLLGESTQLVVASIGDSWTHSAGRWCGPTATTMQTTYGDAGAGWVGFGKAGASTNGNVLSNSAVTYTGTWVDTAYATSYSPDSCAISSSSVGARLSYTIAASPSAVKLFAQGGAGVVQYRYNGGAWTSVDLSVLPAGMQVITLAAPVAGVFDIEVVSGTATLFGIDVQKATDGVRWHKLGATGSRAQQWAALDETNWKAGLTALAPNLVTVMLATNDQAAYDSVAFKAYMQTIITRVKAALPLADILLIAPCENGRANTYPMSSYAAVTYELAAINKCAFLDLQYVFGDNFSEYSSTSARAWFNADNIHPEPLTGGRAIVDAVLRLLTQI